MCLHALLNQSAELCRNTICAIASICFCIFLKAIFSSNVALAGQTYETKQTQGQERITLNRQFNSLSAIESEQWLCLPLPALQLPSSSDSLRACAVALLPTPTERRVPNRRSA
jgi:hypothetical protein